MPSKSKKQQRLFGLVRALQKNKIPSDKVSGVVKNLANKMSKKSVKDFASTSHKNLPSKVNEAEYSLSKLQQINGKSFDQVLKENVGVDFDSKEILVFQSKQTGFAGFGKVKFVFNRPRKEISTEVFGSEVSKKYVFKKLIDNDTKTMNNYVVFIKATFSDNSQKIFFALSPLFDNTNTSNKIKILSDFIDRINSYGL